LSEEFSTLKPIQLWIWARERSPRIKWNILKQGQINLLFTHGIAYENKELKNYGDDAFDRALKSKDYISFDNEADAEYFFKNYKEYWDKEKKVLPSVGGE
jgi:hypothetical protein